jgi:hypothetical protein
MEDPWYVLPWGCTLLVYLTKLQIDFYRRFAGRPALLEYAAQKNIPVAQTAAKPWSTGNLFKIYPGYYTYAAYISR